MPDLRSSVLGLVIKVLAISCAVFVLFVGTHPAFAQAVPTPALPNGPVAGALDRTLGALKGNGQAPMALSLQVLIIMGLLTILPSLLLMMTSFTRIIIVLSILRQALGLQQTPPNQVLVGLSLFLSLFVMAPTLSRVNQVALAPYNAGTISATQAIDAGAGPMRDFMTHQTRKADIAMFSNIAKSGPYQNARDIPFSVLLPSFVTSELKTAFQIGFLIFLPFIVIDLVVASVLMALGMMMMSPTIISLPFKLLLFVLVDGWALTMGSLANSFVS